MKFRPRSILSKLLALFFVAAVVPLGLLGLYFYYNSTRATEEMVGNRTARLAELVRAELDVKLRLRLEDRLLAANQPVQDFLGELRTRGRSGSASLRELRTYLAEVFVQSGEFYESLVLADAAGQPVLRHDRLTSSGVPGARSPSFLRQSTVPVPPGGLGEGVTPPPEPIPPIGFTGFPPETFAEERRTFQGATHLADGEVRLEVEPGAPGQPPNAVLLRSVQSNERPEVRLGYLAARLRPGYLWPAEWENRRFGERGELVVVEPRTGQVLYHTRTDWIGRPLGQMDPQLLAAAQGGPGGAGVHPWRSVRGAESSRVATALLVRGAPWVVVATAAPAEFASEARRAALLNLLVGTLALVIAMSLIALVGRRMSRSIQLLTAHAQRLSEGDLTGAETRVETHDEVQTLSEAFNAMTRSLRRSIETRDRAAAELDTLNRSLETRVRDRTRQLEELNAALNRANEELKELDRLKSNFLATVSHEFKTPLTSIKAFAEILHDELEAQDAPADMRRFLRIIDSESDRLARLIKNILDLSRIESGRMVWRMTDIRAGAVIDASLDGLLPALKEKAIQIEREPRGLDAVLHGDPDRLQEVFTNVLDNAIKASPPGQRIVIGCHEARGNGATSMIQFSISDQGHGIPTDQLEKIFDRFHQVSPEGRRRKGGTGLGLAISREITEHHGGRIWAEPCPTGGSTFHITLPRAAAPSGPPPATSPPGGFTHA